MTMTDERLSALIAKAAAAYDAMTPEQRLEADLAQRQSFGRGEAGFGSDRDEAEYAAAMASGDADRIAACEAKAQARMAVVQAQNAETLLHRALDDNWTLRSALATTRSNLSLFGEGYALVETERDRLRVELAKATDRIAALEAALFVADETIMDLHGYFPVGRKNDSQRKLNDAASLIRSFTGEDYEARKRKAADALAAWESATNPLAESRKT